MPELSYEERVVQFGDGGRIFGILTTPRSGGEDAERPVFVFLSAGLLHRVGPNRLHVELARELVEFGISSLRVDLSGKGDSTARSGLSNQESVGRDFAEILKLLRSILDERRLVLAGLCSGADNAVRLAIMEPSVIGLVLLDPICYPDSGFKIRKITSKYFSLVRWKSWFKHRGYLRLVQRAQSGTGDEPDLLALRDLPTEDQMRLAFDVIAERNGAVLSVFSSYALFYYNGGGQLERALDVRGYRDYCTEIYWPAAEHTYVLVDHRRSLRAQIRNWVGDHYIEGSG